MFSKILIANRGEIACRVIRTARRMGIRTVAIYSEADAGALHVRMADEAVLIGPAPSAQSYLAIAKVLQAARESGADAVHPGYGFLSENARFAEALAAAGIAFIGPKPRAIAAMGDKIESKRLAHEAGVNTVPGYLGIIADAEEAVRIARKVGYPVMIKASAGGGGKGMRIARNDTEVRDGFQSATNEAKSSFGDDRVFIEKFIEEPRHIEIQVLGDRHGNMVYLGERECSIQRRHQKVIEEAPSPFLDAATRKAMGEQAVALAKAVDYESAGTVEFIVDRDRNFYFLEMNTRLQVEHPVTEYVTGLDLVEQMIRIASGETLSFGQEDVTLTGWAIEARIYAEDPLRNFLPSTGRLVRYQPPEDDGNGMVRIDSGVEEGGEISIFYDPMIAKLVCGGTDRPAAIAHMRAALDAFYIRGISHNIPFLAAVMAHPRFAAGDLSTGFIAEEFPEGFTPAHIVPDDPALLVAVAATVHRRLAERSARISGQVPGLDRRPGDAYVAVVGALEGAADKDGQREYRVTASPNEDGCIIEIEERPYSVTTDWKPGQPIFRGRVNNRTVCVQIDRRSIDYRLSHDGTRADIRVLTPKVAALNRLMPVKAPPDLSQFLLSPMPGLLVNVAVSVGEEVQVGEVLAVVEAMKMENTLRAERGGRVKEIHAAVGASLAVDQAILEFE